MTGLPETDEQETVTATEMVERIARHMAESDDGPDPSKNKHSIGDDGTVYPAGVPRWWAHDERAKALLRLMVEPTKAMVEAAEAAIDYDDDVESNGRRIWRAMIYAAIGEPGPEE